VIKFISKLVGTSKTFLAKGDIYLASDITFTAMDGWMGGWMGGWVDG